MSQDMYFYKKAARMMALLALAFVAARLTKGYSCFLVVFYGIFAAANNKTGPAICAFTFLSLLTGFNPMLLRISGAVWNYAIRFGMLALSLSLAVAGFRRRGQHRLPFVGIVPYLLVATISSFGGYWPAVSLAKVLNYFLFMQGIWFGTQNLHEHPKDFMLIRTFFFAVGAFYIAGSALLVFVPSISYLGAANIAIYGGMAEAESWIREMQISGATTLFCGMYNHSQTLGVLMPEMSTWILCDMLFIEKRFRWPHLVLVLLALPMVFMSRSRVGFMVTLSGLVMITFYTSNKITVEAKIKQHLRSCLFAVFALSVVAGGVMEVRDHTISKWLRKTNDVEGDARGLTEAVTASRMALIDECMSDFRKNPAFGMGFQVNAESAELHGGKGIVFSAPIEKGILPVMVLGETGFIGFIFFVVFLITFYVTALQRRLYVTVTTFTLILVSNMGEAEFFSPGGTGSCQWILTAVGGFIIDTHLLYNRRQVAKTRFYGWSNQLG